MGWDIRNGARGCGGRGYVLENNREVDMRFGAGEKTMLGGLWGVQYHQGGLGRAEVEFPPAFLIWMRGPGKG